MNTWQVVAELGGVGAVGNLVAGVFSQAFNGYRQARIDSAEENRKEIAAENASMASAKAWIDNSASGQWVVRFIVVVSFLVISAPVWVPLVSLFIAVLYALLNCIPGVALPDPPTVGVVWYYTKEGSFWLWQWDTIKEFKFGPYTQPTVVIGILPIFFAISTNIVSFHLLNRVRKKLF